MTTHSKKSILIKLFIFWALFLVFHFAYSWLPLPIVAVFAGNSEGAVQHMKMAFFAYTIASLIEYAYLKIPKTERLRFLDSRLLGLYIVTFAMFLWYLIPAIRGAAMPNDLLEVLYANIVLVLVGLGTLILERDFVSSIQLSRTSRVVIIVFDLVLMAILIIGSFKIPWGGFWFM
jgi:hypothetical protein